MNHEIRGWNECLITYVLAASAPRYPISPEVYHRGWADGRDFLNGRTYYGITLPLGPDAGGPLFLAHYSFLGLDPRGLKRPLRRLLAAERRAHAHQPRALRAQPRGLQGLRPGLLGPDRERRSRRLRRPRADQRHWRHRADRRALGFPLRAGAFDAGAAAFLPRPRRPHLARLRLRRRLQRDRRLVCRHPPRDRPGADRRHDRERPHRACCGSSS